MWARAVNIILGIWMMVTPSILDYNKKMALSSHLIGPVIAAIAIIAISESVRNIRFVNFFTGLWLILSPWFFHDNTMAALLNSIIAGIIVAGVSLIRGSLKEEMGGGWKEIFNRH